MNIAILFSGEFGRRFVINLVYPRLCGYLGACGVDKCDYCKDYNFSGYVKFVKEFPEPASLPTYIENVKEYLNKIEAETIVAINLHPDLLSELPNYAECRVLIVPACDQRWCLPGLRKQLEEKCKERGIEFHSPKPFCSFNPKGDFPLGTPEFEIEMEDNIIKNVKVLRSDPCGCSYYVAKMMRNYRVDNIHEFWKDIHQHQCAYPCMASMERDIELNNEAPFHLAGYIMVYKFSNAAGIDAEDFVPPHFRKIINSL